MAISPSSGLPIAFLDPRNQPRSADPVRAEEVRVQNVAADRLKEVTRQAQRDDREAAYFANRRFVQNVARQRSDQVRAEQADTNEAIAQQRADDLKRLAEDANGPQSMAALNRRDAEITSQRLLTSRQIDRAERNRQFDIRQLNAQREANYNIEQAQFDASMPRGSLVDIQA